MKVYIGPYRTNHISAYTLFDKYVSWKYKEPYWRVDPDQMTKMDAFVERICDHIQTCLDFTINKLIRGLERKVDVRIDNYDTWSMDHTLALIIHPMLIQLRDTNHGFFCADREDVPHIPADDDETLVEQRYKWIMDELVWTFEQLKNDCDYDLFYTEEKGWNREAMDAHHERIKNGLRLFGKYYRALWD